MTPIALTDAQLELVRAAADHLPRDARGAFLEMIAEKLRGRPNSADEVDKAIREAIRAMTLRRTEWVQAK